MERYGEIKARLEACCPGLELRVEEPMSRHTSFRIGGPVPLMALPQTTQEAAAALEAARTLGVPYFVMGKGSNLLVSDEGFPVFVIKCCMSTVERLGKTTLYAGSGASLAQIAVFALEQGLGGMEFAHGIPGTLGGAVFMNAGAYDGEMAQIVTSVDCISERGRLERLSGDELAFSYRSSVFSREPRLILGATLELAPRDPEAIRGTMMELAERRRSKQPLEYPSAGSTFQRPPGQFAGALIEGCGLKGCCQGGAQVSEKHAGFVVNTGGATCEDVLAVMRRVRDTVLAETGVLLEPEVRLLGCGL